MNAKHPKSNTSMNLRSRIACRAADLATWASQKTGRGAGGMIGGLVAGAIDPNLLGQLGQGRPAVIVTGTNGKSTTTRMLDRALETRYTVATNEGGDNMDAGIISALLAGRGREVIALEVDELHVPNIAEKLDADVLVLLNLTRDQLDRVGEITKIERALRESVESRPGMSIIANCDDVQVASVAYDCPNVTWVSAGAGFVGGSASCPRTGGHIVRTGDDWYAVEKLPDGREFRRPDPTWWVNDESFGGPGLGAGVPMTLQLPGRANRGNAAQAVAAAVAMGVPAQEALRAVEQVADVAGRYSSIEYEGRVLRLMLAKNPAGWQEALTMIDRSADSVLIAVNGQVADGQDLSWLWDVSFAGFSEQQVVAAGERGTDLAVRLGYAGVAHELVKDTLDAVLACPPGRVEVLANYTAFRDLKLELERRGARAVDAAAAGAEDAGTVGTNEEAED